MRSAERIGQVVASEHGQCNVDLASLCNGGIGDVGHRQRGRASRGSQPVHVAGCQLHGATRHLDNIPRCATVEVSRVAEEDIAVDDGHIHEIATDNERTP